jgi:cytochrome b6
MSQVDFGWFVRSMHSWGANLMILALFFHLFSTYFMKAYRAPRELTWLTGLGLMVMAMAFGFTGYLLPWDEVSFFATKIGLDITSKLPVVGHLMVQILQGGADVSQATLTRFFLIHVILLPLGFLVLLGLHLVFVQSQGMSEPESFKALPEPKKTYEKFFPDFALKDAMVWLLTLNILATLVTLFPWGLGPEADPFAPAPQGIKPEWYFLAMFQFLKIIPASIGPFEGEMLGLGFFSCIGLIFAITPFIDEGKHPEMSNLATWFGQIVCIGFVVFTIWGFLA